MAGPGVVCSRRISRRSPLVWRNVWSRANASQVGSRTISRRSNSCGRTAGPGRGRAGTSQVLLTQDQQAVPAVWRDGWSRAGASQVGSRTISRRSNSVAGRLVQAGAGPALVRFLLTHDQQAVPVEGRL